MELHPRHALRNQARNKLLGIYCDWQKEFDLSLSEAVNMLAELIASQSAYAMKRDRRKPKNEPKD